MNAGRPLLAALLCFGLAGCLHPAHPPATHGPLRGLPGDRLPPEVFFFDPATVGPLVLNGCRLTSSQSPSLRRRYVSMECQASLLPSRPAPPGRFDIVFTFDLRDPSRPDFVRDTGPLTPGAGRSFPVMADNGELPYDPGLPDPRPDPSRVSVSVTSVDGGPTWQGELKVRP